MASFQCYKPSDQTNYHQEECHEPSDNFYHQKTHETCYDKHKTSLNDNSSFTHKVEEMEGMFNLNNDHHGHHGYGINGPNDHVVHSGQYYDTHHAHIPTTDYYSSTAGFTHDDGEKHGHVAHNYGNHGPHVAHNGHSSCNSSLTHKVKEMFNHNNDHHGHHGYGNNGVKVEKKNSKKKEGHCKPKKHGHKNKNFEGDYSGGNSESDSEKCSKKC